MDAELLMITGTVASGNSVTMISDAAKASRYTYANIVTHVSIPTVEIMLPKCCPITYTNSKTAS